MKKRKQNKTKKRAKQTMVKDRKIKENFKNRMKECGLSLEQVKFHKPTDNEVKMSEVILKLAEPYIKKYWNNDKRIHVIISLAIMAWNISLFPEKKSENYYDKLIDLLPQEISGEQVATFMQCLDTLIDRKKKYFSDIKKVIMHYEASVFNGNITLNITSAPIAPKTQGG